MTSGMNLFEASIDALRRQTSSTLRTLNSPFNRTKSQQVAIAITPKISGFISFTCSATLIYMILASDIKLSTSFRRIIFGICALDMLQSFVCFISTWSSPMELAESYGIWGAAGNDITCSITGWIFEFTSTATPVYMSSLCIHYFFLVQNKIPKRKFERQVEPWLHAVPLIWGIVDATSLLGLDLIHQNDVVCWVAPEPYDCIYNEELECEHGKRFYFWRWIFGAGAHITGMSTLLLFLFVKMFMTVRLRGREGEEHGTDDVTGAGTDDVTGTGTGIKSKEGGGKSEKVAYPQEDFKDDVGIASAKHQEPPRSKKSSIVSTSKMKESSSSHQNEKKRKLYLRSKEAFIQSLMYTSCFFTCWFWIYLNCIYVRNRVKMPYWMRILMWIFFPLQGLFNILAFTRPHVLKLLQVKNNETMTYWKAFWEVIKSGGDISIRLAEKRLNGMRRKTNIVEKNSLEGTRTTQENNGNAVNNNKNEDKSSIWSSATKPPSQLNVARQSQVSSLGTLSVVKEDSMTTQQQQDLDGFDVSVNESCSSEGDESVELYGDYDFDIYDDDHISLDPLDDDIAAAYDDIEDGISWTEDASTDLTTSC
jgi:multidrug transporter EmrE-like cation transporter